MADRPPEVVATFRLHDPVAVAETGIATVWRVRRDGRDAALKVWHDFDMDNEGAGVDLLAAKAGRAAVEILDRRPGALLMEWLDGPSAGDLVRAGADATATGIVADVAARFHATPVTLPDLPALQTWFADLFALRFAPDCPAAARADFEASQVLAADLLESTTTPVALHGDLHHDNIRKGARGWVAHDAKGVCGDLAYELANAFRNPVGADAVMRDPARVPQLADQFAQALQVDRARLLRWAAAHCALSIAWSAGPVISTHADLDLLAILLGIARQA